MTLLIISFALLLAIGLPIALAMMGASLLVIGWEGIPLSVVAQRVVMQGLQGQAAGVGRVDGAVHPAIGLRLAGFQPAGHVVQHLQQHLAGGGAKPLQ